MHHFLSLADVNREEFNDLLATARRLKNELRERGHNDSLLAGKTLAMIFQKPSLRTRVSFEVGMLQLGGHALYLSPNEIQLGKRESVADVARVVGRYNDAIMARVFAHSDIVELAEYAPVPVINGLSNYNHPCQGLSDYFTMLEEWGSFEGRTLAYIGNGNNVLTSLIHGAAHAGVTIRAATPEGYEPPCEVVERARAQGTTVTLFRDPYEAVHGANAIYTDVWASMGQEAEAGHLHQLFSPYEVNEQLVSRAASDAIVLHCLPAHRGEEITDAVIDGSHSRVWDQAENRLHAQKALLVRLLG